MKLSNVNIVDIRDAKKRLPELSIDLFVDACNHMTDKIKKSSDFISMTYELCDDINLKMETVNLDKITNAYNALVRDDMELSVEQMQDIIFNKFYCSIINYDHMLKKFRDNLISRLQAKSNNDDMKDINRKIADAKFDLDILLNNYKPHDLFIFNDRIDDINNMQGYRDYEYRPIRYEDLANALFPNYSIH